MKGFTRKQFLAFLGAAGLGFLVGCGKSKTGTGALPPVAPDTSAVTPPPAPSAGASPKVVVAKGDDPADNVKRALDAFGGLGKWVKPGSKVVLKPNLAWASPPQSGAITTPEVLVALVAACKAAGASSVRVIEHGINPAAAVYAASGIKATLEKAGAEVFIDVSRGTRRLYRKLDLPHGKCLKQDEILAELLEADVFINVPVCKNHNATKVSLSMKNLMGANRDRQHWHATDLHQCIADYSTAVKPDLIVLDATYVLQTNGPQGPGKVLHAKQVIVSEDPVAVDAYGAKLVGYQPEEIDHIRFAAELGVGVSDLDKVDLVQV